MSSFPLRPLVAVWITGSGVTAFGRFQGHDAFLARIVLGHHSGRGAVLVGHLGLGTALASPLTY